MKEISIIIPTYNRKEILKKSIIALAEQNFPFSKYEVIIVDDGSSDGTEEAVNKFISPVNLKYFKQNKKGPAAARNVGIRNSEGRLLLFIGDDIIASPKLLAEHVRYHYKYGQENIAILGFTTWPRELETTSFMKYINERGQQFKYNNLKDGEELRFGFFYTSNVSASRSFMIRNGLFDEDFKTASWEDTEIGYRLNKKGLKIIFCEKAIAYHYHSTDLTAFCKRKLKDSENAAIFYKKHPEMGSYVGITLIERINFNQSFIKITKIMILRIIGLLKYNYFTMLIANFFIFIMEKLKRGDNAYFYYDLVLNYNYLKGLKNAINTSSRKFFCANKGKNI